MKDFGAQTGQPQESPCPICGQYVPAEEHCIQCQICNTPHHKECWNYVPGCGIFGCAGAGNAHTNSLASEKNDLSTQDIGMLLRWEKLLSIQWLVFRTVRASFLLFTSIISGIGVCLVAFFGGSFNLRFIEYAFFPFLALSLFVFLFSVALYTLVFTILVQLKQYLHSRHCILVPPFSQLNENVGDRLGMPEVFDKLRTRSFFYRSLINVIASAVILSGWWAVYTETGSFGAFLYLGVGASMLLVCKIVVFPLSKYLAERYSIIVKTQTNRLAATSE